jgi:hypothetical protein
VYMCARVVYMCVMGVNYVPVYVYIRVEITVLYLKISRHINFRFNVRKYPFTSSANASPKSRAQ